MPKVLISRCLGFAWCRYDGGIIPDEFVQILGKYVEFVTVCPEVGIGLGIPRDPIDLVQAGKTTDVYQPSTGMILTESLTLFSRKFIHSLPVLQGALLKSRSPSCGVGDTKLYASKYDKQPSGLTSGIFAAELTRAFPGLALETEDRLLDTTIRQAWLNQVFGEASVPRQLRK
ncbi:MAG: DUF523 domain-containing protein [FCB group bacterium]|nr:DUF523 domain-containing protein [FCB group bacterium]